MNQAADHVLIIITMAGQITLGAFTASLEDCQSVKETTQRAIDQYNQEIRVIKGAARVNVTLICTGIEK